MATNKKYRHKGYIDGNTARQLSVAPGRLEEPYYGEEQEEQRKRKRYTEQQSDKKRQARAIDKRRPSIDFFSFLFLTGAMAITFFICSGYLETQTELTRLKKSVAVLESDILELETANEAKVEAIDDSLSLDYVYKIATKKYGMVHPKEEQIIEYNNLKSDVVRQYRDIPEGNKKSLLDDILGK